MKVKKYTAPTMPEVMKQVRKELGSDAVILNSKEVYQGGVFGLFKKRKIEVLAAVDPQPEKPKKTPPQPSLADIKFERTSQKTNDSINNDKVIEEVRELRRWMEKNTSKQQHHFPSSYQAVYDLLIDKEVDGKLAYDLIETVMEYPSSNKQEISYEDIKGLLRKEIKNRLGKQSFHQIDYSKKFVHLVGPTGVGKTTTIAKIAANSMLKDKKKVALITTDTYRIAAIEQLKTYSKILDIPLEIAYSIEDYRQAREKFKDYDLVLVDTAGRNFRDPKYIADLGKVVDLTHDIDTYLVLSLTTRATDLEEIFTQFKNIPIKQLIFTKKDETTTFGAILNLCLLHNKGVAYVTHGQDVPDDIVETTVDYISTLIVGE
ncbi:flagellar biosynthesis protein FlhF [Aquibacillus kalidii]|uniref:flagellar biosynthesis protein FlhF n=1 Tax=Aquibacillus kalidii TaxID=2762597 RepID=UPI001644050C|nr:flagellar biosynthesis protein FlhF [Aquibacillus kalidii]